MALYRSDDLNRYRVRPVVQPAPVAPTVDPVTRFVQTNSGGSGYSNDGYGGAMTSGSSPNASARQLGGLLGTVGTAGRLLGVATNDPSLAQFGGLVGAAGGIIGAPDGPTAAARAAATAAGLSGVDGTAISGALGAFTGYRSKDAFGEQRGVEGAVDGALRAGLISTAAKAVGGLPGAVVGYGIGKAYNAVKDGYSVGNAVDPSANAVSKTLTGIGINMSDDPLGAMIAKAGWSSDEGETDTGVAKTTPGVEGDDTSAAASTAAAEAAKAEAADRSARAAAAKREAAREAARVKAEQEAAAKAAAEREARSRTGTSDYSRMGSEAFGSAGWSSAVNSYSNTRAQREGRVGGGGGYGGIGRSDGRGTSNSAHGGDAQA